MIFKTILFLHGLCYPATVVRGRNVSVTRRNIHVYRNSVRWRGSRYGICQGDVGGSNSRTVNEYDETDDEQRAEDNTLFGERVGRPTGFGGRRVRRQRRTGYSVAAERFPVISGDDDDARRRRSRFGALRSIRFDGISETTPPKDTVPVDGETAARDDGFRERLSTDDTDANVRPKHSSIGRGVGENDTNSSTDRGPENPSGPNVRVSAVRSEYHHHGRSAEYRPYGHGPCPGDRPGGDDGRSSSSAAADLSDGSADSFVTADSFVSWPPYGYDDDDDDDVAPESLAPAERPHEPHCRIV